MANNKQSLTDYLIKGIGKYRGFQVNQARQVLQRYHSQWPVQLYWRKDYESADEGLKQQGSQEWLTQRIYLSQLGVYAAEAIRNRYKLILWPLLGLIVLALCWLQPEVVNHPIANQIITGFGLTMLVAGILLYSGVFSISYWLSLPRRLMSDEALAVIEKLMARCCVRLLPANTPRDLTDRFRTLVTDAEGDGVAGQVLAEDLEEPYLANELQIAHWFILLGPIIVYLACLGYSKTALIAWAALMAVLLVWNTPLRQRAVLAAYASAESATENLRDAAGKGYFQQQEKAREQQLVNAIADDSPFIQLGTTTGLFYQRRDPLAPGEANLPFGLSINDLASHLLVNSGHSVDKTNTVMASIVSQWCKHKGGGLLCLDGEGALPAKLSQLGESYQLISPETDSLNPIAGLKPGDIADTFDTLFVNKDAADSTWQENAILTIKLAATLLEHTDQPYTLKNIYLIITDKHYLDTTLAADAKAPGNLAIAVHYFSNEWPDMVEKNRQTIKAIIRSWLLPVFAQNELAAWMEAEQGIQIEKVLTGAKLGLSLPASHYGCGGALISMLVLKRLYKAITQRSAGWQSHNEQTAVMLALGGVDKLVSQADVNMLAMAHQPGLYQLAASQNLQAIEQRLGQTTAQQYLGRFGSTVTLAAGTEAGNQWLAKRLGQHWRAISYQHEGVTDTLSALNQGHSSKQWSQATHYQRLLRPASTHLAQAPLTIIRQLTGLIMRPLVNILRRDRTTRYQVSDAQRTLNQSRLELCPLVQGDEIQPLLARPDTAIAQVIRGGVLRRDVIELTTVEVK